MILLEERLPDDRLEAEAILHVRRHTRRALREGRGSLDEIALFFGLDIDDHWRAVLGNVTKELDVVQSAAQIIARERNAGDVLTLAHDANQVARCQKWLQLRHEREPAFEQTIATDLATLLVVSEAIDLATARAPSDRDGTAVPILIEGETGTGKELLAGAIHEIWARAINRPKSKLNAIHVAGMSSVFISDELFGHAKGAYTGAEAARMGRLEAADKGSALIDEVGDLPADAQVRLLRFLQDQKASRLGENEERTLQVRILAATWHDLDADVAAKTFRLDLLHRLRVGRLRLPPLRERKGAFTSVVPEMLRRLGQSTRLRITRSAQEALSLHPWPGNLRELHGVLRVALASSGGRTIRLEDLPAAILRPYLARPLHERAVGFLSDEVEEQPLTAALASWRVDRVDEDLRALTPPEAPPELLAVRDFFRGIPDASAEHRQTLEALHALVEANRKFWRDAFIADTWHAILNAEPHPVVRGVLEERFAAAAENAGRSASALEADRSNAVVSASPWMRFARDVSAMPFFANQEGPLVMQGVMTLVGILYSVAPNLGDELRKLLHKGGFAAVRDRIAKALKEGDTIDAIPDHKSMTRKDWVELVRDLPTKSAAAKTLDVDTKTITAYLRKLKVAEDWGGRPRAPRARKTKHRVGKRKA